MINTTRPASIQAALDVGFFGSGAGLVFPQCGQALMPKAIKPPQAGQLATLRGGSSTGGTGSFTAWRIASFARNAASRSATAESNFA